jgi:hypothetical protein
MRKVLVFFKAINNAFIKIVLFFFYFVIIGLISVIYRLLNLKKKSPPSYWQEVAGQRLDKDYFSSPY